MIKVQMKAPGLLAAATGLVLAAGCGDGSAHSTTAASGLSAASDALLRTDRSGPRPDGRRDCASRIEGRRLPPLPRNDLITGPIVFHGLREYSRIATRDPSEAFETKNGEYKPLKIITDVRADTVVTVAIAPADRKRATLFYSDFPRGQRALGFRLEEGQAVVRFESCPPSKRRFSGRGIVGPRTQFNGGFLFTESQCLRLDVYDQTRRTARRYIEPYGRARSDCRG